MVRGADDVRAVVLGCAVLDQIKFDTGFLTVRFDPIPDVA
jgi:hypothetical protein